MNDKLLVEAANWYDSQGDLSSSERKQFLFWLDKQENRLAYEKIARAMESSILADALTSPTKTVSDEVGTRKSVALKTHRKHVKILPQFPLSIAASLAAILIIGLLFLQRLSHSPSQERPLMTSQNQRTEAESYTTATATRSSQILSDGSQVYLNAETSIEFDASNHQRHLKLLQGQVMFDIAHDKQRPFIIDIDNSQITVLGTVFDIEHHDKHMTLQVYQGLVRLNADRSITLTKGQTAIIENNHIIAVGQHSDQQPSWRTGWLDVNRQPIAKVVQQLQHYLPQPLELADDISPTHTISGRFNLDQPLESLQLLASISNLKLDIQQDRITMTR